MFTPSLTSRPVYVNTQLPISSAIGRIDDDERALNRFSVHGFGRWAGLLPKLAYAERVI
jgi:hypothetical protein